MISLWTQWMNVLGGYFLFKLWLLNPFTFCIKESVQWSPSCSEFKIADLKFKEGQFWVSTNNEMTSYAISGLSLREASNTTLVAVKAF